MVERLAKLEGEAQKGAIRLLLVISVLRGLVRQVVEEVSHMSVLIDPMQDEFCRELYQKGRAEGEATFLLRVLAQRFGAVPAWALDKVTAANEEQLSVWNDRALQAASVEDLLGLPLATRAPGPKR